MPTLSAKSALSDVNGPSESERRAQRAQRFKHEEKTWKSRSKENAGPRVCWSGGTITSNKEAALQRFLERKAEKGEHVNEQLLSVAVGNMTLEAPQPIVKAEIVCSVSPQEKRRDKTATLPNAVSFLREDLVPAKAPVLQSVPGDDGKDFHPTTKQSKKNARRSSKRAQKQAATIGL
mmetsp:Transcript_48641/g.90621  ORF Transcript_48641/g.90621 Transcript_48641/m.90621 type:complete len:177 (+) Transcript_48641:85-615(+)|eukprot:CAMPEP_0114241090 /NCGR_PEP_ID=MMETSP0058-20121206/9452_1 /TAXON_ID=36894 /ORGANISM="Pyramimonas parkeae, CCMP726" /LENGTH=176 /DNA_ID=CAMNT_0001353603 /DNA_START=79 /DNA_END=609 /DNA_ORIENTATION=+